MPQPESHVLAQARRQLGPEWERQHGLRQALMETCVKAARPGTSYRATHWGFVGQTGAYHRECTGKWAASRCGCGATGGSGCGRLQSVLRARRVAATGGTQGGQAVAGVAGTGASAGRADDDRGVCRAPSTATGGRARQTAQNGHHAVGWCCWPAWWAGGPACGSPIQATSCSGGHRCVCRRWCSGCKRCVALDRL